MVDITLEKMQEMEDTIADLQAYKALVTYLVNRVGFGSLPLLCDYVSSNQVHVENGVLSDLLAARWSMRDRPMGLVVQEITERKIEESK